METGEPENGNGEDANECDEAKRDDGGYLGEIVLVLYQEVSRETKDGCHVQRQWDEEQEKVAVIATADAIVDPRAVMIKCLEQWPYIQFFHDGK